MKRDPRSCPYCGKFNDCHTNVDADTVDGGGPPEDGDCAICIGCGNWSIFDGANLRLPTDVEWQEIQHNQDCMRADRAWRAMDKERSAQQKKEAG